MRDVPEMDLTTENEKEVGVDARVYELGYLLVPSIPEENVPAEYGNLKELVSSLGGIFVADDMPKMLPLAYEMSKVVNNVRSKFNTAYFGWIKFSMEPVKVLELKKKLDLDPNVLRFLIFKTVKENTIAAKRFVGRDMHRKPVMKKPQEGGAVPMDKEAVDKEIDALVEA